jgi:hypothetical protein
MNLTGIGAGPEPLELGSLLHRALADWIVDYFDEDDLLVSVEAKRPNYLTALFIRHATQRQQEITKTFEETTGRPITTNELDSLHNVVELGLAMTRNYQDHHKSPLPEHMKFASPEQEVLIPVPGTEHICKNCKGTGKTVLFPGKQNCKECEGKGTKYHFLSATLDGLLQDSRDRLLILEHKTYENRPKLIDLQMNDQFTGYCWVVTQLNIGKVVGIAYDGMWKREKPPKYMQKEKRAGTMDDLFIRKILPKSEAEIEQWGINLAKEINEMANNPPIYPNVPWQGCSDCNFIEPCLMEMHGEDPSALIKLKYGQREIVRGGNIGLR